MLLLFSSGQGWSSSCYQCLTCWSWGWACQAYCCENPPATHGGYGPNRDYIILCGVGGVLARQGCGNASYWTKAKTQVNKGNKARMKYDNFVYNGGGNFLLGHPPYISHHWWLYLVQGRYVPSMTLFVRQSNMATCTNTMADISHLDFLDIFFTNNCKAQLFFFLTTVFVTTPA